MVSFGSKLVVLGMSLVVPLIADGGNVYDRRIIPDSMLQGKSFDEIPPCPVPDRLAWFRFAGERAVPQVKTAAAHLEQLLASSKVPADMARDEYVRYLRTIQAIELLLATGNSAGEVYLMVLLTCARQEYLRLWAYTLLTGYGGLKHRSFLYRGLRDPNRSIWSDCMYRLGHIGDQDALPHLEALARRKLPRGYMHEVAKAITQVKARSRTAETISTKQSVDADGHSMAGDSARPARR